MNVRIFLYRNRIFVIAFFLSVLWHIFWLSAVNIVVLPDHNKNPKFSKVSFLGPILSGKALELRIGPKAQSFLERKLFASIGGVSSIEGLLGAGSAREVHMIFTEELASPEDRSLAAVVDDALSGTKLEPDDIIDHRGV